MVQPLSVMPRGRRRRHLERGAAAVEMALVLPVMLFLLMGMIDFGRAYNAQIQLSAAAREGVRLASLNTTPSSAGATTVATGGTPTENPYGLLAIAQRVDDAAGGLVPFTAYQSGGCSGPAATSSACVTYCPVAAGDQATVVLTAKFTWITGISGMSKFWGGTGTFPTPTTIQATGVMRCTG